MGGRSQLATCPGCGAGMGCCSGQPGQGLQPQPRPQLWRCGTTGGREAPGCTALQPGTVRSRLCLNPAGLRATSRPAAPQRASQSCPPPAPRREASSPLLGHVPAQGPAQSHCSTAWVGEGSPSRELQKPRRPSIRHGWLSAQACETALGGLLQAAEANEGGTGVCHPVSTVPVHVNPCD